MWLKSCLTSIPVPFAPGVCGAGPGRAVRSISRGRCGRCHILGCCFAARMSQQSHGQPQRQGTESHLLQGQAPHQRTPSVRGRRGGSFKAGQGWGRTPSFLQGSNSCICRWLSAPSRGRTSALPAAGRAEHGNRGSVFIPSVSTEQG